MTEQEAVRKEDRIFNSKLIGMSKLYENSEWKEYRKKGTAEMRPVDRHEILTGKLPNGVSVSDADKENGSPNAGDMIARNPENHDDMWLVAKEFFQNNYEPT